MSRMLQVAAILAPFIVAVALIAFAIFHAWTFLGRDAMSEVQSRTTTNNDRVLTIEQGLALALVLGTLMWTAVIGAFLAIFS